MPPLMPGSRRARRRRRTFVKLHDARIVGLGAAWPHGRDHASAFTAEFAGDADKHDVTDVWTFERNLDSADPNWMLVATSGESA